MATLVQHLKDAFFRWVGIRLCTFCLREAAYSCLFSAPEDGPEDRDYFCEKHARHYRYEFCGVQMLPLPTPPTA